MDDQEGKASDGDQPDFITGEYGFHTVDLHIDGGRLIGVTVWAEDGEIAPSELLGLPAYVDAAMEELEGPTASAHVAMGDEEAPSPRRITNTSLMLMRCQRERHGSTRSRRQCAASKRLKSWSPHP